MSQENAQKFLAAAQQDTALQAQIKSIDPASEALTQLAHGLGYDFTLEEFQAALDVRTSETLDDATLEHVVGGSAFEDFFSWLGDTMKNSKLGKHISRGSRPF